MSKDPFSDAIEALTVSNYQIIANHAALMSMLSRGLELTGTQLSAGETTAQTYDRLRKNALEQILLTLGDTQPKAYEDLKKLIDGLSK